MTFQRRSFRIVGALAALLLFQSAAGRANVCVSERLKPLHHFCGKVVASNGELLGHVKISVQKDGKEILAESTGSDGGFDFNLTEPGEYEVHAEAAGFVKMSFRFKLSRPSTRCKGAVVIQLGIGGECDDVKFEPPK